MEVVLLKKVEDLAEEKVCSPNAHTKLDGQLDGDDVSLQKRVGTLLGLKVTATADGWSITR